MKINRSEIIDVVRDAREREEPVVLTPQGLAVSFFCQITEVSEEWIVMRNPVPPEMAPIVQTAPSFSLFVKEFALHSDSLLPFGTAVRFPIPDFADQMTVRNLERVYFTTKDNAVAEIQHPFDSATVLSRRIFDLSSGGMSFRARVNTPFIQPGRVLPDCQIFVGGELRETHKGRVVYVKKIVDLGGQKYFQVGVQFATDGEDEGSPDIEAPGDFTPDNEDAP